MLKIRIIPCLDVHGGRVVKGHQFRDLRDAGDPLQQAQRYDQAGADELVFLDISATHEERAITLDVVQKVAEACFMPLTVGGGVRQVDDIRVLLNRGADKVALNSAAVANPSLIDDAAACFGSQCVVVAIDAKRRQENRFVWRLGCLYPWWQTPQWGGCTLLGRRSRRPRLWRDFADIDGSRRKWRRIRYSSLGRS